MNMKKCILGVLSILTLCACHESLEDRAAREAADFTKKNCPMKVSEGITIASMVFGRALITLLVISVFVLFIYLFPALLSIFFIFSLLIQADAEIS